MTTLIYDHESNGFLRELTKLHCLWIKDHDTGEMLDYADQPGYRPIREGIHRLEQADVVVGHNILKHDEPAIHKVYPWYSPKAGRREIDTMVLGRMMWPELKKTDAKRRKANPQAYPGKLVGSYALKAFGLRMGTLKGDYEGSWDEWNLPMHEYGGQDVVVTSALYDKALRRWHDLDTPEGSRQPFSDESVWLEMDVARIVARQERWGIAFDVAGAARLYAKLSDRRTELETELRTYYGSWVESRGEKTSKANNKKHGHVKGAVFTQIEIIEFNPKSLHHIANRLKVQRGWEPQEFTDSGLPKLDETVLAGLPWPEAKPLLELMTVNKRIAAVAEGKEAWLKHELNGRIHGGVNTCGAVTSRMTHSHPNLAQVPGVDIAYGPECRELFGNTLGALVGCDADSLEGRCMAGYMAVFDGGERIEVVLRGDKKIGTDEHSVTARALGLDPKALYPVDGQMLPGRAIAKTWFYAMVYGSGDENLGFIVGKRGDPKVAGHWKVRRDGSRMDKVATEAGKQSRATVMKNLPALGKMTEAIQGRVKRRGFLWGLDKRKLFTRSPHSALNMLLQAAGAILMKRALVILDANLQSAGLIPGKDYEFCLNIHDEWQIDSTLAHAALVGKTAEDAIRLAGEFYGFDCPLSGTAKTGANWKATH